MREHNLSFIYEVLGFERCTQAIYAIGEDLLVIDDGQGHSVVRAEEALEWCRENEESDSDERYNDFCQSEEAIIDHNGDPTIEEINAQLKAWGFDNHADDVLEVFGHTND